jgi:DNA helicase-2/ATP-dependent DNA helicase PcrA
VNKLVLAANDHNVSTWTVMENINDFGLGLNAATAGKIGDFVTLIKGFSSMLPVTNPYDLGEHIAQASGILRELYNDKTPEGVSRYENIQELLNGLKEFAEGREEAIELPELETGSEQAGAGIEQAGEDTPREYLFTSEEMESTSGRTEPKKLGPLPSSGATLADFMQDIALLTDADEKESPEDRNRVSLMTIHAAKGLEFPYVFVVGLEENLFPSQLSLNSRTDLEEERRLFYVALTRAEKRVTISYAATRYRWGNLISCEPSRFIEEIASEFLDFPAPVVQEKNEGFGLKKSFRKKEKDDAPAVKQAPVKKNLVKIAAASKNLTSAPSDDLKDLQVGMEVYHERFGNGKVVHMEGYYPNNKATVEFPPPAGVKQLLLKFAKLKILN